MGKIQVMSRDLANRIAAGEVIERPASVVKELVENSIDANARRIFIQIERAGTRLIQVRDDGCGMSEEDALLSLQPHGTSKLKDISDLDNILTLGFRGEALPSIASVSRFTLKTREKDAASGTKISYAPDGSVSGEPDGSPAGTTVEVRDLFYNTPARKKFLKSPATEEHHIEEAVLTLALGHPETGFELRIDNRVAFILAADSSLEVRIRELFGKNFAANMLKINHRENNLHITGLIGSPGFTRPSRKEQRIFINSRAVESPAVYRGIRDGFGTLAPESGRFPPAVICLDMDPSELDVNVHPAKREVRFRSEFAVTRAVASAVGNALRGMALPVEEEDFSSMPLSGKVPIDSILDAAMVHYHTKNDLQPTLESSVFEERNPGENTFVDNRIPVTESSPESEKTVPEGEETPVAHVFQLTDRDSSQAPYAPRMNIPETPVFGGDWPETVLGVYDNTYILCSGKEGLMLIDQHAAHERILFEQIVDAAEKGNVPAQKLLLPKTLELPRSQIGYLLNHQELFAGLGFDIESAGGNTVLINSVPASFSDCRTPEEIVPEMLAELLERSEIRHGAADLAAAARAACKAAVKAHEAKTRPELEKLLRDLRACRQGTLCPHGRPTMITLSRLELERRFGRR
ncbi:MAG: DNA mismatch repair endonuclease MutL [Lentisphaeria bacterium]|nr:DNA mismatch repair endonuclease MutL [Lentisphaeria bacterium]